MTPELKMLGLVVLFIVGGIATHFFHTWNRIRLNHLQVTDHMMTDFILGGFGTLIIFSLVVDYFS
jgi:hypothetical protein